MSRQLKPVAVAFLAIVIALVALAWLDGGRSQPRQITQPVTLPESIS